MDYEVYGMHVEINTVADNDTLRLVTYQRALNTNKKEREKIENNA
jgi:hypothetical protein